SITPCVGKARSAKFQTEDGLGQSRTTKILINTPKTILNIPIVAGCPWSRYHLIGAKDRHSVMQRERHREKGARLIPRMERVPLCRYPRRPAAPPALPAPHPFPAAA